MYDDIVVTLDLDDGSTLECGIEAIFETQGREYIALSPLEESDEWEVYFYRYVEDENGEPGIENIEDDEEYEIVLDAFDELLDNEEFEEYLGDDDED